MISSQGNFPVLHPWRDDPARISTHTKDQRPLAFTPHFIKCGVKGFHIVGVDAVGLLQVQAAVFLGVEALRMIDLICRDAQ